MIGADHEMTSIV